MAYSRRRHNKQKGNMLNILAGITLSFLNVLCFCSKCFGIYSVINFAVILIKQIWNTLRKYDCLPRFAVSGLSSIISKPFSLVFKNRNFRGERQACLFFTFHSKLSGKIMTQSPQIQIHYHTDSLLTFLFVKFNPWVVYHVSCVRFQSKLF